MAEVIITPSLQKEIVKKFKQESIAIFSLLLTLEKEPKKGKEVGAVGNVVVKELKYKNFRFYFITDRYKVKFISIAELKDLIIKIVRMSDKNNQQDVIDNIKNVLVKLGDEGF